MRRINLCVIASSLIFASISLASAQGAEVRIGGCTNKPSTRPTSITLTCADAGIVAHDLVWNAWGKRSATASGLATVKTCTPDCATGGSADYPVVLTADSIKTCRDGSRRYTRLRYGWPQTSPFPADAPASTNPYLSYPCPLKAPLIKSFSFRPAGFPSQPKAILKLRLCAPAQKRMEVRVVVRRPPTEEIFNAYSRNLSFSHRGGCATRRWSWSLRDEFWGAGRYSVTVQLYDSQGQPSSRLTGTGAVRN